MTAMAELDASRGQTGTDEMETQVQHLSLPSISNSVNVKETCFSGRIC